MKLEVLVSTLDPNPKELITKMNIQTDAIIICQSDKVSYEEVEIKNNKVKIYYFNERGVGLSRNNALMRATGKYILFADDDEIFVDNYEEIIINEFKKTNADFIVFDINAYGSEVRKYKKIYKDKKIHFNNCLKYGAVRFAVKTESLRKKNIVFNQLFGGGCIYGSGEDSIFIFECIKKKMQVYQNHNIVANVNMEKSSWFRGYNEKYYMDKGALFAALNSKLSFLYLIAVILKNNKADKDNPLEFKLKCAIKGFKSFIKSEVKY